MSNRKKAKGSAEEVKKEVALSEEDKAKAQAEAEVVEEAEKSETDLLEEKIASLEEELEGQKQSFARLYAEFDNYKKRTQKEKSSTYKNAIVEVNKEWLPIIDNLDRASDSLNKLSTEDSVQKYKEALDGVLHITKQGEKILFDQGVEEIEALGKEFDPNLHEAVAREESSDGKSNIVTEVFVKGYTYKGSVLRHSIVKVAM